MKRLFLIFILAYPSCCIAQPWMKTYGPFASDGFLGNIVESYDHGFVMGGHYLTPQGKSFGWVVKTDVNGEVLWEKNIGLDLYNTSVNGLDKTLDKGLIMAGYTTQFDLAADAFFLKLDSCGNKSWCVILKTPDNYDFANEIHQLPDQTFIALVTFYSDTYNKNIWLFRIDEEGNTSWSNFYKQDTNYILELGFSFIFTSDTCILISGTNYTEVVPGSGLYWHSPFWVKVDKDGNEIWEATWHQQDFLHGDLRKTVENKNKYYIGAGNNGVNAPANFCLYKLNFDGTPNNRIDLIPSTFFGSLTTIEFLADSSLVLGGMYFTDEENSYATVLNVDSIGNILHQFNLPINEPPQPTASLVTSDNKILILIQKSVNYPVIHWSSCLFKFNSELEYDSIYTVPYSYDTLCSNQIISETIPLDCWPVGVNDDITGELNNSLTIAPNPASGIVTFKIPETFSTTSTKNGFTITKVRPIIFINLRITIYDNTGSKIFEIPVSKGDEKINTDVTDWREGLYMVVLQNDSQIFSSEKLIVTH
jgi:hypothetical protein